MAIYLGTSLLTGGGGGGGGGGEILKEYKFTSSGTLNLTTLGIGNGDTIYVFVVGGGSGGQNLSNQDTGGSGGAIWRGPVTLGTAGTVTVTVGAGGAAAGSNGGASSISGGGIPSSFTASGTASKISSGTVDQDFGPNGVAPNFNGGTAGLIYNGTGEHLQSNADYAFAAGSGIDGYGIGGTIFSGTAVSLRSPTYMSSPILQNTGRGGGAISGTSGAGFSGVVKIIY